MRTLLRVACCVGVYFVTGHNVVATLLAIVAAIAASVPAPAAYSFPRSIHAVPSFVRIDRSIGAEQIGIPDKLSMN